MRYLLLTVASALHLSGCADIDRIPDSWDVTPMSSTKGCPDIDGTFENYGEKPEGGRAILASWIAEASGWKRDTPRDGRYQLGHDLVKAKWVALSISPEHTLKIQVIGEGISRIYVLPRDRFECKAGVISIGKSVDGSGDNVAMLQLGGLDIHRTKTHLLANDHGAIAAVMLVVPIVGYGSNWARFAVANTQ